jgi:hypothetical protein
MAVLWYSRQRGGKLLVDVTFQPGWNNLSIRYDQNPVGVIPAREELEAGREFRLENGSVLMVKLPNRLAAVPEVYLDGQRLHPYAQAPQKKVHNAFVVLLLIAILNLIVGALAIATQAGIAQRMGGSVFNLIYGAVFLVLAFLVKRGSLIALAVAVALFLIDSVLAIYFITMQGKSFPILALVLRGGFLVFLVQGFTGIRQLKAQ